jgi:CMP-N-acetylneuraminic acid synthetase
MNVVAIIPARGGSKRVPRKNVSQFRGHPMIWYAIRAAQAANIFTSIIVSTDDQMIADVANSYGAVVSMREPDDGVRGTQELTAEVLRACSIDTGLACCIYPCVPMLLATDLISAHHELVDEHHDYVMSIDRSGADIGMFYFGHVECFLKDVPLHGAGTAYQVIPDERAIDINTQEDWKRAEHMYDSFLHNLMLDMRGHV